MEKSYAADRVGLLSPPHPLPVLDLKDLSDVFTPEEPKCSSRGHSGLVNRKVTVCGDLAVRCRYSEKGLRCLRALSSDDHWGEDPSLGADPRRPQCIGIARSFLG